LKIGLDHKHFAFIISQKKYKVQMLEYFKVILQKVSFDHYLFEKELKKAIGRLISAELKELRDWCFTQFSPQFDLVLKDCFQGIRLPERGRE
jgi:hypothetical protein